jgi:CRISPR-associated Cas5-like protein
MISLKALIVEISFFEAFFKVHYTKGFRLTYPIPLPTSTAGIFGAFLGIEREKMKEIMGKFLFGSKLKKYESIISESVTFLQYKPKVERGVIPLSLINNPTYLIAIVGKEKEIREIENKLKESIKFLPYGGQNDFFIKDWRIIGIEEVEESDEITNYAPQDWVKPGLESGIEVQILPVMHKLSENPNFYFIINGKIKLKRKIYCTKNEKIGVYELNNFNIEY